MVCSLQKGNRWKWIESVEKLRETATRFANKGRDAELLVFVSAHEFKLLPQAFRHSPRVCDRSHTCTLARGILPRQLQIGGDAFDMNPAEIQPGSQISGPEALLRNIGYTL